MITSPRPLSRRAHLESETRSYTVGDSRALTKRSEKATPETSESFLPTHEFYPVRATGDSPSEGFHKDPYDKPLKTTIILCRNGPRKLLCEGSQRSWGPSWRNESTWQICVLDVCYYPGSTSTSRGPTTTGGGVGCRNKVQKERISRQCAQPVMCGSGLRRAARIDFQRASEFVGSSACAERRKWRFIKQRRNTGFAWWFSWLEAAYTRACIQS